VFVALVVEQVWSAGQQTGYIKSLLVHWPGSGDGKFDVVLASPMGGSQPGACSQGEWSGYLNTAAGRAQYAMLLAAQSSNQEVTIQGNDFCESTREVIRNVNIVTQ
jgi:hypothetical protein